MDLKRPHSHLVTEPAQPDKKPRPSSPVTANGVARSRRSGSPTKPKVSLDEDEDEDEEMDSLTKVVEVSDRVSPALVGRAMGVVNGRRGLEGRVCQSVGGEKGARLLQPSPFCRSAGRSGGVRIQCGVAMLSSETPSLPVGCWLGHQCLVEGPDGASEGRGGCFLGATSFPTLPFPFLSTNPYLSRPIIYLACIRRTTLLALSQCFGG